MKVAILVPVFDDWESLRRLLARIDDLALPSVSRLRVVVVDDGSSAPAPPDLTSHLNWARIDRVILIELTCNLGHQRAIALGLAFLAAQKTDELVVVMDADGEDEPDDVSRLIEAFQANTSAIVVAERTTRSEGFGFRLGYRAYRIVFELLTGRQIRFGNFCAIGIATAARLANTPSAWNHIAATVLRSGIQIVPVPTRRGHRYAGKPSTNLISLLTHGLSALAVFSDFVFARLLLFAAGLACITLFGALSVIVVRVGTDLAVPGWATVAVGVFAIMLIQALLLFLIGAVQLLASRSQAGAVPSRLVDVFIHSQREFAKATL